MSGPFAIADQGGRDGKGQKLAILFVVKNGGTTGQTLWERDVLVAACVDMAIGLRGYIKELN